MKVLLIFPAIVFLTSCSRNSPHITKNETIVQEDPRVISETNAVKLINPGNKKFTENLRSLYAHHRRDFNFSLFWDSLRYPQFNLHKITPQQLKQVSEFSTQSCSPGAAKSYFQFLDSISSDKTLKTLHSTTLELATDFLHQCKALQDDMVLAKGHSIYAKIVLKDSSKKSLITFVRLSYLMAETKNLELSKYLRNFFSRQRINSLSESIIEKQDISTAIEMSNMLKSLYPYQSDLSFRPLSNLITSSKSLKVFARDLNFEILSYLVKGTHKVLVTQKGIENFYKVYNEKREDFFSKFSLKNMEYYSRYLEELENQFALFQNISTSIPQQLKELEKLASAFHPSTNSTQYNTLLDEMNSSLIAQVALAKDLPKKNILGLRFERNLKPKLKVVDDFIKARTSSTMSEIAQLKKEICQILPTLRLHDISEMHQQIGCFEILKKSAVPLVLKSLSLSFFSVLTAPDLNISIKSPESTFGIVDLSSRKVYPRIERMKTPDSHHAIGLPLIFALESKGHKYTIEKDTKYYFVYHLIARESSNGTRDEAARIPKKGHSGGTLILSERAGQKVSFISYGGEGQEPPEPMQPGQSYKEEIDFLKLDLWILDFMTPSYLFDSDFQKEKDFRALMEMAVRNKKNQIKVFIDKEFFKQLSSEQQEKTFHSLDTLNQLLDWKCSDIDCKLEKATMMAVDELTLLYSANNYDEIFRKMSPNYQSKKALEAEALNKGEQGDQGEILFFNAL